MAKRHPLHEVIGKLIHDTFPPEEFPNILVIRDEACGGKQRIPFFRETNKFSRATTMCNVDLLIVLNNKIKVIVEIEEANIKPTQICGKFLTTAISECFRHKLHKGVPILFDKSVLFLQIIDTSKLKERSAKNKQVEYIEKSIQENFKIRNDRVMSYKLILGNSRDFGSEKQGAKDLVREIQNELKK